MNHSGQDRSLVVVGNGKAMRGLGPVAGKEVDIVLNVNIISQHFCSLLSLFFVWFNIAVFGCW